MFDMKYRTCHETGAEVDVHKLIKVALAVVAVVVVAGAGLLGWVSWRYDAIFTTALAVPAHKAPPLPRTDEEGEGLRLLKARGCAECHGADFGGRAFLDDPGLGALQASNLSGGAGSRMKDYSDDDLERLIRHSLRPDGTPLLFMPAEEYWSLGDDELGLMIQALRALPPVDRVTPAHTPSPVLKALSVFGVFKISGAAGVDHHRPHQAPPAPGPTAAFGEHLAVACVGCHGAGLSGGRIPGTPDSIPVPTNLTPAPDGLGGYDQASFFTAMRTGKRPDGTEMNPFMPWAVYRHMTDDELTALYLHLRALPPAPFGGR
jgi:cytochrome c553